MSGFLPSTATTGGVNWDWRLKDPRYSVTGYWAGSTVRGSAEAIDALQQSPVHYFQRPDAGYLDYDPARTSMSGHAGHDRLPEDRRPEGPLQLRRAPTRRPGST